MSFFDLSALRAILTTETDADSPINEELMSQIRENLEAILILLASTGITGSATSDPPNDTTGYLTDTASTWSNDDHNGRTLLITSGLAKGNMYTIDDTDDANNRLVCTGDNLYADGVRSGDTYLILYDVKNNTDGHDHDGVNSKWVQNRPTIAADTVCIAYDDNEHRTNMETYTKKAEAYIAQEGSLRIKFKLKNDDIGSVNVYGRIYRNGVAIGTERVTQSTSYVEYSEDIAGWSIGDLCQIYLKTSSSAQQSNMTDFELWADLSSVTCINPIW